MYLTIMLHVNMMLPMLSCFTLHGQSNLRTFCMHVCHDDYVITHQHRASSSPARSGIICHAAVTNGISCRCLISKSYSAALPLLDAQPANVDPSKTALTARSFLLYCYYGAMLHIGEHLILHTLHAGLQHRLLTAGLQDCFVLSYCSCTSIQATCCATSASCMHMR